MKKNHIVLSLSLVTMYACTCIATADFNPGPLDNECIEAGLENWYECEEFLLEIDSCEPVCEDWKECGGDGCGGECGRSIHLIPYVETRGNSRTSAQAAPPFEGFKRALLLGSKGTSYWLFIRTL